MTPKKAKKIESVREAAILQMLVSGPRYGLDIRQEYQQASGDSMPLGSLYTTMQRIEDKGFVTSELRDSASERGGNRRRYFRITGAGMNALNEYVNRCASFGFVGRNLGVQL